MSLDSKDVQIKELTSSVDIYSTGLQDSAMNPQFPSISEVILSLVEVHLAHSLSLKEPLISANIVDEPIGISLQTKIVLTEEYPTFYLSLSEHIPRSSYHGPVSPPLLTTPQALRTGAACMLGLLAYLFLLLI